MSQEKPSEELSQHAHTWRDFFKVIIAGSFFVEFAGDFILYTLRGTDFFGFARYFLAVLSLSYVIVSIGWALCQAKKMKSRPQKIAHFLLLSYVVLCICAYVLIGYFSPFAFAGSLAHSVSTGSDIRPLFYPLFGDILYP